jgi:hypothetical protein
VICTVFSNKTLTENRKKPREGLPKKSNNNTNMVGVRKGGKIRRKNPLLRTRK